MGDPLTIIDSIIGLAQFAATAFGKAGLANLAGALKAAADKLVEVKDDPVTKDELEQFRLSPKW